MKNMHVMCALSVGLALLIAVPLAYTQVNTAPQEKVFSGLLVKVDTTTKLISAKSADDKEMMFNYTEQTQVIGPDKSVQGLAARAGSQLRINYHEELGANWATKIELVEKK